MSKELHATSAIDHELEISLHPTETLEIWENDSLNYPCLKIKNEMTFPIVLTFLKLGGRVPILAYVRELKQG